MDADIRRAVQIEIGWALERAEGQPIQWGRDDCLMWIADIYRNALGEDPAAPFRNCYSSEAGAIDVLGPKGVPGGLMDAVRRMGWKKIEPLEAQPGDLGMIDTERGPAGVIRHREFWVGRIENGFSAYPDNKVLKAWSIG